MRRGLDEEAHAWGGAALVQVHVVGGTPIDHGKVDVALVRAERATWFMAVAVRVLEGEGEGGEGGEPTRNDTRTPCQGPTRAPTRAVTVTCDNRTGAYEEDGEGVADSEAATAQRRRCPKSRGGTHRPHLPTLRLLTSFEGPWRRSGQPTRTGRGHC